MMGRGIRFELGQVIQTLYDAAGFLRAQFDGLGASPNVGSAEVISPHGFHSRARDPDTGPDGKALDGGGAKVLIGLDGTEYRVLFLNDQRALKRIPPLKKGGSVQFADTGKDGPISIDVHDGEDGTKQIYVEIDDSAHVITVGRDGNKESVISITHADGMALELFKKKTTLKNANGKVYIEMNDDGGTLNGNWKIVGDIADSNGVSLLTHVHATAMGPTPGRPLPGT